MRWAVLSLVVVAGASLAQPPSGPPPSLHVVRQTDAGKGRVILTNSVTVIETRVITEKVVVNGVVMDVTKTIGVPVLKQFDTVHDIAAGRVITPDGKQLLLDEASKKLTAGTVVAVSGNFDAPSAAYLRTLNPQTLVIIPAPPKVAPPMQEKP
jgi:hypothetical protein